MANSNFILFYFKNSVGAIEMAAQGFQKLDEIHQLREAENQEGGACGMPGGTSVEFPQRLPRTYFWASS